MAGSLAPAAIKKTEGTSDRQHDEANHAWFSADEEERLRKEERALMQLLRERAKAA